MAEQKNATTGEHHYGQPLSVSVEDGQLRIIIGVNVLAYAVSYSDWACKWRDGQGDDSGDYFRDFAITDAKLFAEDVARAMLNEEEDGSSPLSNFLDKATEAAVDDGSMACEYELSIPHGTTAPSETWADTLAEE